MENVTSNRMCKEILSTFALVTIVFVGICASDHSKSNIPSLPYCPDKNGSGFVLVSTLDGKLSAINSSGQIAWEIITGPGPLLNSNIHQQELTNNGEWIRIIPSLTGTLYKFDGITIDAIPITADMLLKASFRYSDDLVIAGGIEVRKYGVGFHSGKLLYECTPIKCLNEAQRDVDDVLLVERITQTIRAIEPHTGHERWNFSVGIHNITVPSISCKISNFQSFDWNISAVLPEGIIRASAVENDIEHSWTYTFSAPIVRVWTWSGSSLTEVNLFAPKNIPNMLTTLPYFPSIYIGMHQNQLYIQESLIMQHALHPKNYHEMIEGKSVAKIPWKPIAASKDMESHDDGASALSVLHNSKDVNGNGFYLYSEENVKKKDSLLCGKNESIQSSENNPIIEGVLDEIDDFKLIYIFSNQYFLLVFSSVSIILIFNFIFRKWSHSLHRMNREIIIIEKPVEAQITMERKMSEKDSESSPDIFSSRYENDFETIRCLGKGGFGVVFEVKQKIDECHYAIKRITLPNQEKSRDRVMREVKALAKLEHQNIVRYFCSWVEHPPIGWEGGQDQFFNDFSSVSNATSTSRNTTHSKASRFKSESVSIDLPLNGLNQNHIDLDDNDSDDSSEDSFVVFENSPKEENQFSNSFSKSSQHISVGEDTLKSLEDNCSTASTVEMCLNEHSLKKINWKRPGRRHHSWDLSQNRSTIQKPPPVYLYIQMQLCQKHSLKDWLRVNYEREYEFVLDIFRQILQAVEYVHQRGLIHRDLKPGNIFFSLDGQIKVGDFGLVKDIESALEQESFKHSPNSSQGHTRDVGTKLYMSPEQFQSRLYDCKVDIYALGLIFFELLVPFSTDMERIKTLTDVKKQMYPVGFPEKFPHEFNLLQNMLCADPKKRLTTVDIKSRPPLNISVSSSNEAYQYNNLSNLPKIR